MTSPNRSGLNQDLQSTFSHHSPSSAEAFHPIFKMAEQAQGISRETAFYLRRGIDYFNYFRRGEIRNWNENVRQSIYMQFPIPFNRTFVPDAGIADPEQPSPIRRYLPFSQVKRTDDGAGRTVPQNIRRNIESLGWRMLKILGAGSQGLAVLFESVNDGSKAVFKWGSETFSMAVELWAMRQMVGARHIVQVRFHTVQAPLAPDLKKNGRWPGVLCSHSFIISIYSLIGPLKILNDSYSR